MEETIQTDGMGYYPYYFKANEVYKTNNLYEAKRLIEICIQKLENGEVNIHEDGNNIDQTIKFLSIRKYDVYQLAGEIYALSNNPQKAMECYKKFWYWSEQLKQKADFENKDSIVVYSFRRFNEYTLSDLINKEITVCHPSKMNDPFDSPITLWGSEKYLKKICSNNGKEKYIPYFSKTLDYFRIRSFVANRETYDADDNILKNILMWSFYADEHNGFCIRYRLSKHFILWNDKKELHRLRTIPITYVDNLNINETNFDTDKAHGHKYKSWEYENEVRLLSYCPSKDGYFHGEKLDESSSIEEIIFGLRCPDTTKQTIQKLFENSTVKFSYMHMKDDNIYSLTKMDL